MWHKVVEIVSQTVSRLTLLFSPLTFQYRISMFVCIIDIIACYSPGGKASAIQQ